MCVILYSVVLLFFGHFRFGSSQCDLLLLPLFVSWLRPFCMVWSVCLVSSFWKGPFCHVAFASQNHSYPYYPCCHCCCCRRCFSLSALLIFRSVDAGFFSSGSEYVRNPLPSWHPTPSQRNSSSKTVMCTINKFSIFIVCVNIPPCHTLCSSF